MSIDLSILICSTHTRYKTFGPKISDQVWGQYAALSPQDQARIEILMLTDNKAMMLGQKRNVMVDMAQGTFVQFIDDDDRIEPDMFASVLAFAGSTDADVITFLASVSLNGAPPKICRYSMDYPEDRNTAAGYERLPNHICAVRRTLASQVSFPNVVYGEDSAYSKLLRPLLRRQISIDRVLYHYDYSSASTETQQHLAAALRRRDQPPLMDVVILSNASTHPLRDMTQRAIESCIAGANSLPVNVIVMEQLPGERYDLATTLPAPPQFHYNAFANTAAATGSAEWIMIANNDLIFHDGWLHALLAASHPVVSPKCPRDHRQADVVENTSGYVNAVHFSGWCFAMRRVVWDLLGGLDESVEFWCSDDAVIEQLRTLGIAPMLVPGARVEHLGSVTLKTSPHQDELTWGQLDKFIQKHGGHELMVHPKYQKWRQDHGVA